MTVRFVARLAIAIAAMLGSAILCWGQIPQSSQAAGFARYDQSAPSATPPRTIEGTWVSDDQSTAAPPEMFDAQQYTGGMEYMDSQYGASDYDGVVSDYGDGAICSDDCDLSGDCGDGCRTGFGGCFGHGGFGGFLGRHCCDCPDNLWDEVHAHRRTWVAVDYLSMWAKGNYLPPLVTTSPPGTPQSQVGVLPVSATTSILYGNGRVDLDQRNGARINVGYWLVDGEFLGLEGQYFALETQNSNFFSDADILARPFINVDPILPGPTEDSSIIALPDFQIGGVTTDLTGSINVETVSNIQSANMTLRRLIWIDFTMQRRVDLLLGYRFFRLEDSVKIDDASTIQPAGIIPLTMLTSRDLFRSRNQFHGGEIGIKAQSYHGPLMLEGIAKCAFGNNRQRTWIDGFNTTTVGGITTTGVGGLLTQPTNIGSYRRDVFTILPEANVNLKLNVTCNLRLVAGYTFIYANRVQRSGDAIDRTVNPTQINGQLQGEARPAFFAKDTPFWLHGYNAGLEYRW